MLDGRADLVFNFGAPYLREVIGSGTAMQVRSTLDAQRLVPIRIVQRGLVRIAGVRFHLGGLGAFATGSLHTWTGLTPAPHRVLGADVTLLEAALERTQGVDAQAQLLDAFFASHLSTETSFSQFQALLRLLVEGDGRLAIATLAKRGKVTSRQLARLFARYLGLPPKTTARVLRFQNALRALMREPSPPLAEIAASADYFDQSHFVKDFKKMTGGVPRGYRGYYPPTSPTDFAPNVVSFLQDPGPQGAAS